MTSNPNDDRPFKLGFLTHVHGAGRPARAVYQDLVEFFVAAEELGFDGGWVAQHHLRHDYGRLPSPLVLLAAVAARTTRLELGTGIVTLPLEDPLRTAEDAAVLDELSGGRVQLGLGSGGANLEAFTAFGRDVAQGRHLFREAVRTVDHALRGGALRTPEPAEGAPPPTGPLTLNPAPTGLADRVWQATSTEEGARFAASLGHGLMLGTAVHDPRLTQRPLAEAYLNATLPGNQPRVVVVRAVFPAADRETAAADLAPAMQLVLQNFARGGYVDGVPSTRDEAIARLNVHLGHPDEIVRTLRADPALLEYVDYFTPVVSHEASTLDADLRRLEILACEIAPALGWHPAGSAVAAAQA